jgi:hypothetical protein
MRFGMLTFAIGYCLQAADSISDELKFQLLKIKKSPTGGDFSAEPYH